MSWNPSSRLAVAALLAVLVFAAVGTVSAITVTEEDVPEEVAVNDSVTATVEFEEPFAEETEWNLEASTHLEDPTWTIEYYENGDVVREVEYEEPSFLHGPINRTGETSPDAIRVEVTGQAPPIDDYRYGEPETFDSMDLVQVWNDGLNWSVIGEWETRHHSEAQMEAEAALDSANATIQAARENGTDVSDAEATFQDAVDSYESGSLDFAIGLAEQAEEEAQPDSTSSDDDGDSGGDDGGGDETTDGTTTDDTTTDSESTDSGDAEESADDDSDDDGGFGFLPILVVVLVLALIGGGGFYLHQQNQGPQRDPLG